MRTPPPPPTPLLPHQIEARKKLVRIIKIIGITFGCIIALVVLLAIILPPAQRPASPAPTVQPTPAVQTAPPPPPAKHYTSITSDELEVKYRADYEKADKEYTGKVLLIRARVDGWNGSDLMPALNLNEGYTEAHFTNQADETWIRTLHKGQHVDIFCKAGGAPSVTLYLWECQRPAGNPEAY